MSSSAVPVIPAESNCMIATIGIVPATMEDLEPLTDLVHQWREQQGLDSHRPTCATWVFQRLMTHDCLVWVAVQSKNAPTDAFCLDTWHTCTDRSSAYTYGAMLWALPQQSLATLATRWLVDGLYCRPDWPKVAVHAPLIAAAQALIDDMQGDQLVLP